MEQTRKAIFLGLVKQEKPDIDFGRVSDSHEKCDIEPSLSSYEILVSDDEKYHECYLEIPPLKRGEELYINEIDITVTIVKRVRSTKNEDIYYTTYLVKTLPISDEDREKSDTELNEIKKKHYEKVRQRDIELTKPKKRKWWKFWRI